MENKILEAVKALGGDLRNTENYSDHHNIAIVMGFTQPDGEVDYYQAKEKSTSDFRWFVACTIDEFNTYAEQWLKEAYMHNAALDLDWDIDNVKNSTRARDLEHLIADKLWRYYGSDTPANSDLAAPGWTDICSVKEFIDYCEANKPCEEVKTEWDGEGLPPVGSRVIAMNDNGYSMSELGKLFIGVESTLVARFKNAIGEPMAALSMDDGACCCLRMEMINPIKSPRDKAIDEMFAECYPNKKPTKLMSIALGKLYDAGYRKEIK